MRFKSVIGALLLGQVVFNSCEREELSHGLLKCHFDNLTETTVTVSFMAKTPDNVSGYYVGVCVSTNEPNMTEVGLNFSEDGSWSYVEVGEAKMGQTSYGFTVTGLAPGTKYYARAFLLSGIGGLVTWGEKSSFSMKELLGLTAVDLGLSVKWSTYNIGASKAEGYGGFYQWAGTKDVSDRSIYLEFRNCPYHTGDDSWSGWSKYIPSGSSSYWGGGGRPDNKITLDSRDDIAHIALRGDWRMPTETEWMELMNTSNCSWTWMALNGVNGYKVQSKKSGYTANWIFLPAAGKRDADELHNVNSVGVYWSSSVASLPDRARSVVVRSDWKGFDSNGHYRCCGLSVRPVSE